MRKREIRFSVLCAACAFMFLPSCVNDDYDLNNDIDMTVGVGGDLTLPASGTVKMKMKEILDLEDDGIVKALGEDSIYYLVEGADEPSTFSFNINPISIDDPAVNTFSMGFTVPNLETLMSDALGQDKMNDIKGQLALVGKNIDDIKTQPELLELFFTQAELEEIHLSDPIALDKGFDIFDFDFSMPDEVVLIDSVYFAKNDLMQTDVYLTTDIDAGKLGLHKVVAKFPGDLEHDNETTGGHWLGQITEENEDGVLNRYHRFLLPDDVYLSKNERDHLYMEFIAMEMKYDKNNTSTPGVMKLESKVQMEGSVDIQGTLKDFVILAGNSYSLMVDDITMNAPTISSVKAVVKPVIDEETTTIELNDLPDFLTEEDGVYILKEPRINLNVNSNVVVDVNCWGTLTALKEGAAINGTPIQVSQSGTDYLQLKGNSASNWCLYDGLEPDFAGYRNFHVPGLKNIIAEIPEKIDMTFQADVNPVFYTIDLGREYTVTVDYQVECPLALAAGSKIVYTETVDGLNEDLDGIEVQGLNIGARLHVEGPRGGNNIPFDKLDLTVQALDLNGNPIPDIVITPLQNVNSGDAIRLSLTCKAGAMKSLDALSFEVVAKVTNDESAPLSALTTIQLTDVTIGIVGGVIADLN